MSDVFFLSFWSINSEMDLPELIRQLDQLKAAGIEGVVFHPRNYPDKPEYLGRGYMEMVSRLILEAKVRDMIFWIYDENGWPSGSAGGVVLKELPDLTCEWLERVESAKHRQCEVLCSYEDQGVQYSIIKRVKHAINSLSSASVQKFIDITYEGYRRGLSKDAFLYITGFFTDEVGFLDGHGASFDRHGVPWTDNFNVLYQQRYGQSLLPHLAALFSERLGSEKIRQQYWELLTDLLNENFYKPINNWCAKYGKRYTAHLKGEENAFFQVSYSGSVFQNLKHITVPAIDALERVPGNHYFPHIASSIARQFHDGKALCEAMGGSGWGISPESFTKYFKWLIDCGINQFVFHLSQYNLRAQAICDWPPSMPLHLSWREAFPFLLRELRNYADKKKENDLDNKRILIITPTRAVMGLFTPEQMNTLNEHNGDGVPNTLAGRISKWFNRLVEDCFHAGIAYDVSEERIIEEYGVFENNTLRVGNAIYTQVIEGDGCQWNNDTVSKAIKRLCICDNTPWEVVNPGDNAVLLEWKQLRDGNLFAEVASEQLTRNVELVLSDPVSQHKIEKKDGKILVTVLPYPNGEKNPIGWLKGDFLVDTCRPYQDKDDRQLYTDGPFFLKDRLYPIDVRDLVIAGFPFRITPFILEKELIVRKQSSGLLFTNLMADAVHIWINGQDMGWIYGQVVKILAELKAGTHQLRIEVCPSTFNHYGPHHHLDGDRYLTSPAQYAGEKNFADYTHSPEFTLVEGWHFVKCGIGNNIVMLCNV